MSADRPRRPPASRCALETPGQPCGSEGRTRPPAATPNPLPDAAGARSKYTSGPCAPCLNVGYLAAWAAARCPPIDQPTTQLTKRTKARADPISDSPNPPRSPWHSLIETCHAHLYAGEPGTCPEISTASRAGAPAAPFSEDPPINQLEVCRRLYGRLLAFIRKTEAKDVGGPPGAPIRSKRRWRRRPTSCLPPGRPEGRRRLQA